MLKKIVSQFKEFLSSDGKTEKSPLASKNIKMLMRLEDPEGTMKVIKEAQQRLKSGHSA